MRCIYCSSETRVIETRDGDDNGVIRNRKCQSCQRAFLTDEHPRRIDIASLSLSPDARLRLVIVALQLEMRSVQDVIAELQALNAPEVRKFT